MIRPSTLSSGSALALVLLAGCSVDDVGDLFGRSGGSGGGGQGGAGATVGTQGPATGVTTGSTTGATMSVTTGDPQTVTTTTGDPQTSNTTTGPDPLKPTVFCDDEACAPGQVCCYYRFDQGQDYCSAPGTCPDTDEWAELACNGPDDCPNAECCGTYDSTNGWTDASCHASCSNGQLELCYDDLLTCELGTVCKQSQSLGAGYMYCGF